MVNTLDGTMTGRRRKSESDLIWFFQVAETFTFTLDDHDHDHDHDHDNGESHDHDDDHENEINPEDDLPVLKDVARLDNCVTVIDACNFDATFNTGDFLSDRFEVDNPDDDRTVVHLMIDQIEFANIIVLNKVDMVKPADLDRIKKECFLKIRLSLRARLS